MNSTSGRRATTPRRRVAVAAGSLLAGAAIPLAAAGTAWADESSDNAQPAIPVAAAGPASSDVTSGASPNTSPTGQTETVGQLESQGLSFDEAIDVVRAEKHDIAVQVSYDGTTVVNANQGGASGDASATTSVGATKDVAAAIGGNSDATATAGSGTEVLADRAFADGTDTTAQITGGATDSKATAIGTGATADVENNGRPGTVSNDVATASNGGSATIENISTTDANFKPGTVSHDVANASNGGSATIENDSMLRPGTGSVSYDTATATDDGSTASFDNRGNGALSHDVATASDSGHAVFLVENGANNTVTGGVTHDAATATAGGIAQIDSLTATGAITDDAAHANGAFSPSTATIENQESAGNLTHDVAATTGGRATVEITGGTGAVAYDTAISNRNFDGGGVGIFEQAGSGNLTHDVAIASDGDGGGATINGYDGNINYDAARADNSGEAFIENGGAGAVSHDTAFASGLGALNPGEIASGASIENVGGSEPVSADIAIGTNGGDANVVNDANSTVAVVHDTATADYGQALVQDAASSRATAVNTDPIDYSAGGSVIDATDSTARTEGAGSTATVEGTSDSYITNGHAVDLNGTSAVVTTSDTIEIRP